MFALHQLIAEAAERDAEGVALRADGRALTYGELDVASNAVARSLIDNGVGRGDRVALYLPKGWEAIVCVYGVMKAGAAYVPIDPNSPVLRAGGIVADCAAAAVVTTNGRGESLLAELGEHSPALWILVDDEAAEPTGLRSVAFSSVTAGTGSPDPGVPVVDTDLAYVLYTSGSTGPPKGVMLTHRHALTFIEWCATRIGTDPADTFSSHAPLHFDLSVFDLYVAARGGATVTVVPESRAYFGLDLARFIVDEGVTVWYSVPSALMALTRAVENPPDFSRLRAVVFAGEVYPTKHLRVLKQMASHAELWNLYGPTETNVCTYYRVGDLPDDDRPIPIGRACENTEVFAVRDDGRVAGVGEEGELYVRGSAVMKGYWGRPDLSAGVLVPNPLAPDVPELVYRTGDLVRLREDGDYDFFGRRDHQIKSRGYRIELGEIEVALLAHPDLVEAVAVTVPHEQWGAEIVAYVIPREGAPLTATSIKGYVAKRIPRYMVPSVIQVVAELPRTSTGKVDRQRLVAGGGLDP